MEYIMHICIHIYIVIMEERQCEIFIKVSVFLMNRIENI